MKIPFDDIDEIKECIGFIDADFTFRKLKPYLKMALEEVIKIIGKPTCGYLSNLYGEELDYESNEWDLLSRFQTCIALRGIGIYAPLNDVSFTNQGRAFRTDEHLKAAFEWMIDKSDSSMEKIYYKSLDRLIDALDEFNPTISAGVKWKDTDAFKNSFDNLFRTTDEFDFYFNIESRYLLMKLIPGIRKIQEEEIIPRIGKEKFNEIIDKLKNNEPAGDSVLLGLIREACAYLSLSWGVRRMSAKLFPEGVLQSYKSERLSLNSTKTPMGDEVGVVSYYFEQDGKKALRKIEDLMRPPSEFSDCDLLPNKINPKQKFVST